MKNFKIYEGINKQRTIEEVCETRKYFFRLPKANRIIVGKVTGNDIDSFEDGFNVIMTDENGNFYEVYNRDNNEINIYRKVLIK